VAVAASKIPGVRASMAHDSFSARQGVEDDDMNVLALGARVIGPELAAELVRTFLAAQFSGAERHVRRRDKVAKIEHDAREGKFDREGGS
jgi:ribose 5-phosphate isomerase B